MTEKKRRRLLIELRELGIDIEIPRETYKATYMREIYRNKPLEDLLREWRMERRSFRRRAKEVIQI